MSAHASTNAYDIAIVGGGHNGLISAFYLAQAGLKVVVLEGRHLIGGCCVTEELIPGYHFSSCANVLWSLRPLIVKDLGLMERGLTVDTRQFLRLLPDGRYFFSGRFGSTAPGESVAAVQAEIAKFSTVDAAAFPAFQAFIGRLSRVLGPWLLKSPPRLHEIYAACTDPEDRQALDLVLTNSVAQIMDRFFESDLMRDSGIVADFGDVRGAGTGLLFALIEALGSYSETGQPVLNGFVRGGMGRVTALMAQAAVEQGAEIRLNAAATRIQVESGRVTGVELASGETVRCRAVASNLDPKRTFLKLIAPDALPAKFLQRIGQLQTAVGAGLKIHCALSEMLDYRVEGNRLSTDELRRSTLIIAPNRAYRDAAWQAASQGELPAEPLLAGFLPSVFDASLAPAGKYSWSAFGIWVPAKPKRGTWAERKEEMAENIFRLMDRHTRNFRRAMTDYVIFTPGDLEARSGLTDGNIHHVDAIPSQMFWQRPLEELARYRTPIAGLYLCGSGTHPWGEVNGGPGHNAAQAILADLRPGASG